MARYRKQQNIFDNTTETRAKLIQMKSSQLGCSSIDWDDSGDDDESLDITVSDTTVAKYGHDASGKHGFLVPNGGGWRTVQEDAQAKADAAESAANSLNTAMHARMDTAESDINTAQADINSLEGWKANHAGRIAAIEGWLTLYLNFPNNPN